MSRLVTTKQLLRVHLDLFVLTDEHAASELRAYCIKRMRSVMLGAGEKDKQIWLTVDRAAEMESSTSEIDQCLRTWLLFHFQVYQDDKRLDEYVKSHPENAWDVVKNMCLLKGVDADVNEDEEKRGFMVQAEGEYA